MAHTSRLADACKRDDPDVFDSITSGDNWTEDINVKTCEPTVLQVTGYITNWTTYLCIASEFSRHAFLVKLLKFSAKPSLCDSSGNSALHQACRSHKDAKEKVELLLQHDPGLLMSTNIYNTTPLHLIAKMKDHTICEIALKYNCNINSLTNKLLTPLHIACFHGRKEIVKLLIDQTNTKINFKDAHGDTPLHHAASRGHLEVTKMLKGHEKCQWHSTNHAGRTADEENPLNLRLLHEVESGVIKTISDLERWGAIYVSDSKKEGPLHKACKSNKGAFEKVKYFVERNPELVNSPNISGYLPIHLSARQSDDRIIRYLITKCDLNSRTNKRLTPLHIAAFHGDINKIKLLFGYKACDVNAQDIHGNNPLHYGLLRNHSTKVKLTICEMFLSHPDYKSNSENIHGKAATQIMCPLALVTNTTTQRWVPMHALDADTANRDFKSMTLIQGHIYTGLKKGIVIYDLELQELKSLTIGSDIGEVYKILHFEPENSKDLLITAERGIFHLTEDGKLIAVIAEGHFDSLAYRSSRIYATNKGDNTLEIYELRNMRWRMLKQIELPESKEALEMTIMVSETRLYIGYWDDNLIYELSHEGKIVKTHGKYGRGAAGEFRNLRLCQCDNDGALLAADCQNRRLQVLRTNGSWSFVETEGIMNWPDNALCIPGRLYILDMLKDKVQIVMYLPKSPWLPGRFIRDNMLDFSYI